MKILLVEDDVEISDMLKNFLTTEDFTVRTAYDGVSACREFFADTFSLVLLDLMIPKKSGMEVMKTIRESSTVPIIIISAKDTDSDKALGLGLGADDYITKPFSVTEVLARIKANIRRSTQYAAVEKQEEAVLTKGGIVLDTGTYSVTKNGQAVELTAKEFEILKLLMKNPKKVYTKEQLYSLIWNDVYCGDENAVNVHISRLRNKIEDNPRNPQVMELINQFFTLAKLEAGDQNLQRVKVNICEVCRENILSFYELLRQKEFTVDIGIPEHALFAWGDTDAIHRILSNLISNAVRYGSEGNYIGMFVRKEADAVIIEITDKGKGIEKAFAERVFERLYTMEDSRNRDIQGNGLGLMIARNLARKMGGVCVVRQTAS